MNNYKQLLSELVDGVISWEYSDSEYDEHLCICCNAVLRKRVKNPQTGLREWANFPHKEDCAYQRAVQALKTPPPQKVDKSKGA